jgi:hypothetical protein
MINRSDVTKYHKSVMSCSPLSEYVMWCLDGSVWFAYAKSLKDACAIAEKVSDPDGVA